MGKFKDKYKATTKLFTDNVKEKKNELKEQLKENPFEIIPIEDFEKIYNDPICFLEEKFTDMEFIGSVITMALECVPYIGPLLGSVFSMFWPEDPQKKVITKEELDEELKKFKTEIMKEVDTKIEKSEQEMWKDICKSLYDTLIYRVKDLKDPIIILKKKIKQDGEIDSAIASDIRSGFTEVRFHAHQISDFCRNEKYCHLLITTFMRALFIQCSVMNQLTAQWYQFEIDKYFISGLPAEGKTEAVKSLKEKYHDNLSEGLQYICAAVYKNIKDGKPELNKEFDEKAENLFNTNTWLYPAPLVVAPLTIHKLISQKSEVDHHIPTMEIPDRVGPHIYRIDAASFQYNKEFQAYSKGKIQTYKEDPLTKCKGAYSDRGLELKIKFARKRTFKIRVFGIYAFSKESPMRILKEDPTLTNDDKISIRKDITSLSKRYPYEYSVPTVENYFPTLPPFLDSDTTIAHWRTEDFDSSMKDHCGFTTTKKFENLDTLNLDIGTNPYKQPNTMHMYDNSSGIIKFVEIIFLDN